MFRTFESIDITDTVSGKFIQICLYAVMIDLKVRWHDPLSRIRVLLVPKIGSCEHMENDLPTHEFISLKKGWK